MEDIKIIVKNKVASVVGTPSIVCGNNNYTLSFAFDDEWNDEQNKVARFTFKKNGLRSFIDVPIKDDACRVPVMLGIGLVRVGVYAGNLKTTTGAKIVCIKSILCNDADEMEKPFQNLYDELKKEIENIGGANINLLNDLDVTETCGENDVYSANAINVALSEFAELVIGYDERITAIEEQAEIVNEVSALVGGAE